MGGYCGRLLWKFAMRGCSRSLLQEVTVRGYNGSLPQVTVGGYSGSLPQEFTTEGYCGRLLLSQDVTVGGYCRSLPWEVTARAYCGIYHGSLL